MNSFVQAYYVAHVYVSMLNRGITLPVNSNILGFHTIGNELFFEFLTTDSVAAGEEETRYFDIVTSGYYLYDNELVTRKFLGKVHFECLGEWYFVFERVQNHDTDKSG